MVVQHNLRAMNSNRMLGLTANVQSKSTEKLSSGYKINRAADDAAGLSISEKMRKQIRGLTQASLNADDGISAVQTAEGALNEVQDMLQRMNELSCTQYVEIADPVKAETAFAGTDKLNASKVSDSAELAGVKALPTTDATATVSTLTAGAHNEYTNQKVVLTISKNTKPEEATEATTTADPLNLSFQVGADTTAENKISVDIQSMSSKSFGIEGLKVDGKDSTNADAAVDTIAAAIQQVSTQRSALGAVQNRLEHTINNVDNVVENTTAAESQIRDTDMATEMVKYSNNNILAQAGQAMLAQANQANQGVLSLLG